MVLKETIDYYVNYGSTVYCTMLDATKAFDTVEYCKLFRLLASRDLPSAWLRLLENIYTNSSTRIASNGICSATSALFFVDNGVKQGGVMFPILFCIYYIAYLIYWLLLRSLFHRQSFRCLPCVCRWHNFIRPHHRCYAQCACNLWLVCKRIRLCF